MTKEQQSAMEVWGIEKFNPFVPKDRLEVYLRMDYLQKFFRKEVLTQIWLFWIGEGTL